MPGSRPASSRRACGPTEAAELAYLREVEAKQLLAGGRPLERALAVGDIAVHRDVHRVDQHGSPSLLRVALSQPVTDRETKTHRRGRSKRSYAAEPLPPCAIRSSAASSSNRAERELRRSADLRGRRFGRPVANKTNESPAREYPVPSGSGASGASTSFILGGPGGAESRVAKPFGSPWTTKALHPLRSIDPANSPDWT